MSSKVLQESFITPVGNNYIGSWIDLEGYSSISIACLSNSVISFDISVTWSQNKGIDTDYWDESNGNVSGSTAILRYPVKSRYVQVVVTQALAPQFRIQIIGFTSGLSLHNLKNLGAGVKLYETALSGIRSVISSDNSVTLVQNSDTIDVKVASSPSPWVDNTIGDVVLTNINNQVGIGVALPTRKLEVVDSQANQYTTFMKNNAVTTNVISGVLKLQHAGSQDTRLWSCLDASGTEIGYFSNRNELYTAGRLNAGGALFQIGATNSILAYTAGANGGGASCILIGDSRNGGGQHVAIGTGNTGAFYYSGNTISIGHKAGNNGIGIGNGTILIGQNCGANALLGGANEIVIGQNGLLTGVAGRVSLASVEAVSSTATAGSATLPANPQAFIPITWNGVNYKIPVYLP